MKRLFMLIVAVGSSISALAQSDTCKCYIVASTKKLKLEKNARLESDTLTKSEAYPWKDSLNAKFGKRTFKVKNVCLWENFEVINTGLYSSTYGTKMDDNFWSFVSKVYQ